MSDLSDQGSRIDLRHLELHVTERHVKRLSVLIVNREARAQAEIRADLFFCEPPGVVVDRKPQSRHRHVARNIQPEFRFGVDIPLCVDLQPAGRHPVDMHACLGRSSNTQTAPQFQPTGCTGPGDAQSDTCTRRQSQARIGRHVQMRIACDVRVFFVGRAVFDADMALVKAARADSCRG